MATRVIGGEITTRLTGRVEQVEHRKSGRVRLTLAVLATNAETALSAGPGPIDRTQDAGRSATGLDRDRSCKAEPAFGTFAAGRI